jgi:hypothetical protein
MSVTWVFKTAKPEKDSKTYLARLSSRKEYSGVCRECCALRCCVGRGLPSKNREAVWVMSSLATTPTQKMA